MEFKKIKILLKSRFYEMVNNRQFKFIILAFLMIVLMSFVLKDEMFKTYPASRSGAFTLICACIWLGIFNSIQVVCSSKHKILDDFLNGMHAGEFIVSELVFQFFICFIQSCIVIAVFIITFSYADKGIFTHTSIEYFIIIFLTIYTSDVMGFMLSSLAKNSVTAMELMPFVLVVQMILPGTLFELKGKLSVLSNLTISKWSMDTFGSIADFESLAKKEPIEVIFNATEHYEKTLHHFAENTFVLLGFIIFFIFISYLGIRKVKKDGL